jgi:hypothetical protein
MNSVAQRFARGLGGFLIAAAMLSQGAAAGPVRAAPNAPAPKRVALVLIAGLTFDDLQQMPALRDVARKGSTALMSTRTGRAIETPFGEQVADPLSSGYLTMAAGARASGGSEIAGVFSVQDRARAQLWSAYQRDALPETGLAAPWMGAAATQARAAPYEVPIGALGKALREGGIACEIVGVADTPDDVHREAALFALGPDGLAPGARMSGGFVRDEQYPFGVRTPVEELGGSVRQALARARFVVIETGDAARYERCKTDALPAARTRMRKLALDAADAIVRETERALPADALLVVTSPGQLSDPDAAGADRLSPLIVYGAGTPAGLLISASTRRAGVVANTDISASLASWLGVLDRLGPGHAQAIEAAAHPEPLALLKDVHSAAAYQDRTQPAIYALVYGACAFILFACVMLPEAAAISRAGASLALAPPAAFLAVLAVTNPQPSAAALACGMAVAALTAAAIAFALRRVWTGEILAALAVAAIPAALLLDILPRAAGSYTIQGGARYYGIGNEYGGFFVGAASFLAASAAVQRHRWGRRLGLAGLAAAALFCGAPALGANAGVMLGALAACAAYTVLALPKGQRGRAIQIVAIGAVLVAAVAVGDSLRPPEQQSHVGRAVNAIARQGPEAAFQIIARKADLNLMLLGHSPWSVLLAASVAGTLLAGHLAGRRGGETCSLREGTLWAAALALLMLNDSGVLAAGACGIWLFASSAADAAGAPGSGSDAAPRPPGK